MIFEMTASKASHLNIVCWYAANKHDLSRFDQANILRIDLPPTDHPS
jgi:hypothetical protein